MRLGEKEMSAENSSIRTTHGLLCTATTARMIDAHNSMEWWKTANVLLFFIYKQSQKEFINVKQYTIKEKFQICKRTGEQNRKTESQEQKQMKETPRWW